MLLPWAPPPCLTLSSQVHVCPADRRKGQTHKSKQKHPDNYFKKNLNLRKMFAGNSPFSPKRVPKISLIICRASKGWNSTVIKQVLRNGSDMWLFQSRLICFGFLSLPFTWVTFSNWDRILASSCLLSCNLDLSLSFSFKASAYIWTTK